jgi:dephospho-CoA kinase
MKAHQPYVIAIIGGIASGKSTIAKAFKTLGAQVIQADVIAKNLYQPGMPLYEMLTHHFGAQIIDTNAEINRPILKKIIIDSPQEKAWLETQIHPLVRTAIHHAIQACRAPICVLEIPLLKDRSDYPEIDYILLARCEKTEQLKRLMKRNALSESEAHQLIQLGIPPALHEQLADEILDTTHLREQDLMDWASHFIQLLR